MPLPAPAGPIEALKLTSGSIQKYRSPYGETFRVVSVRVERAERRQMMHSTGENFPDQIETDLSEMLEGRLPTKVDCRGGAKRSFANVGRYALKRCSKSCARTTKSFF